jgi:23S rRNA (pseudouridine1915-N3)-methyltransferase
VKISLIAVGKRMPAWVEQGYLEYARRMPRECQLELIEIEAARRGKSGSSQRWMEQEGQRMLAALPRGDRVVALDVKGHSWSTEKLAQQLEGWMQSGNGVSLLVGGPDGLSPQCLQHAQHRWSLSALTLPHPLVRVVLAEQLYRAWSVVSNHPYHRA